MNLIKDRKFNYIFLTGLIGLVVLFAVEFYLIGYQVVSTDEIYIIGKDPMDNRIITENQTYFAQTPDIYIQLKMNRGYSVQTTKSIGLTYKTITAILSETEEGEQNITPMIYDVVSWN